MDAKNQLMHEKTQLLTQITEAAQRGESQDVLAASERLKKVESLIHRYEKLVCEISDLNAESRKSGSFEDTRGGRRVLADKDRMQPDAKSAREIGKTIRAAFLQKVSEDGYHLRQIKGNIYETQSGQRVGIAVATERQPDRWFLGLPLRGFEHAILLCRRDTGDTMEICLPKTFFAEYGDNMSQSKGQMKFNIARRGKGYVILVPGTGGVSVSEFPGDYSLLQ